MGQARDGHGVALTAPSSRSIVSSSCAAKKIVRNWTEVQCGWAHNREGPGRTTGRCLLPNNPVHYLQSALGQSGHRDDNIGGIDSWGTLMAYLPMPEGGGPHERWCASCKTPIKDEQRSVRIAFDHDPHGYRGLTGIYHVHCSRPFQSLAHALKVLSFRSF
jgi:hypothetical protein